MLRECTAGTEFNNATQSCVDISEGGCTLELTTIATDATTIQESLKITTDVPNNINDDNASITENATRENDITASEVSTDTGTTTSTEGSKASQPICPPGFWGNVPNPERCNAFYMCVAGTPMPRECTAGTEFNPETENCVPMLRECTTGTEFSNVTLTCIPASEGGCVRHISNMDIHEELPSCEPGQIASDPENCDQFYMCAAGGYLMMHCNKGEEFDPAIKKCSPISENGCFHSKNNDINDTDTRERTVEVTYLVKNPKDRARAINEMNK
ncbi:unnamed protein product [Arctia plantaginis]|uniref:Chitin-binding type-2 domain-containing protein n=1 Tax=Arctia plantaginis TaxID=874455 RepID=A0A8S0ZRV2_ARCPL|nr:unnamed protein product [Arctia plantaginis]